LCCYPPGEKHAPRKSRTTISDIINRLGQLERTIVAISSSDDQPRNHGTAQLVVEPPSPDQDSEVTVSREGTLLDNGYSSRYVNDVLLSRVLEEVCFILFSVNERIGDNVVARNKRFGQSLQYRPWTSQDHDLRCRLDFSACYLSFLHLSLQA
jgi:hypothetical protein